MARAASTYRGARRNACMRPDPKTATTWGPPWYFKGCKHSRGHAATVQYEPYEIKSRRRKIVTLPGGQLTAVWVARQQPKVYRGADKSKNERRAARFAFTP